MQGKKMSDDRSKSVKAEVETLRTTRKAGATLRDDDRQRLLLEIANVLTTNLEPDRLFGAIAEVVHSFVRIDRASLALYEPARDEFEIVALALHERTKLGKGWSIPHAGSRIGKVFDSGRPYLSSLEEPAVFFEDNALIEEGMHTGLVIPLRVKGNAIGTFNVNCRREHGFSVLDVSLLTSVADQIAIAVANSQAYQSARRRAEHLKRENAHLQDLIHGAETAASLLLHCPSMRPSIDGLIAMAQSDATILVVGETGSGKGVMARALHAWSGRRHRPFLRCDCAAISGESIEAEFFGEGGDPGDEAHGRRPGRFERAQGATVWLNQVAEIPLDAQARLLSVIQEHTIERPGLAEPIATDFRAIVTTNRDLAVEVAEGRFREDLYYRLKVMMITVPPLRERPSDIIPLAEHFLTAYARATKKKVKRLSAESVRALRGYSWPGNIRELDHVIERAMVLHPGDEEFKIDPRFLDEGRLPGDDLEEGPLVPLAEFEARYIRRVLQATRGRIAGPRGAAKILGLPPSTLRSRMEKLGIGFDRN
jgi:formate hydrogenlyase transcriptional activator